jgi:hypothetical protein
VSRGPARLAGLGRGPREQLIQIAFAQAAAEGKNEKMEWLCRYLAGDQFTSRIEALEHQAGGEPNLDLGYNAEKNCRLAI